MRKLLFIPMLFLAGCSALPTWLGGAKNTIEALAKVNLPGQYTIAVTKAGQPTPLYSITFDCTVEAGKTVPECRHLNTSQVPANGAVVPVK